MCPVVILSRVAGAGGKGMQAAKKLEPLRTLVYDPDNRRSCM